MKGVVNVKRTNPMNVVKRIKGSLTRFLKEEDGVGVVEVVLILVVLIGLIVIFKSKLTVLLNSFFSTIAQRTGFLLKNVKSKGKREYYIVFKPCIDDDFKPGIYSAGICTPLWIRGAEQNGNGAFAGIQNGRV